jgi:hypothetical protein
MRVVELMVGRPVMRVVVLKATVERERRERTVQKLKKLVFWLTLDLIFVLPQAMKSTSIYRRWKRVFSSIPV